MRPRRCGGGSMSLLGLRRRGRRRVCQLLYFQDYGPSSEATDRMGDCQLSDSFCADELNPCSAPHVHRRPRPHRRNRTSRSPIPPSSRLDFHLGPYAHALRIRRQQHCPIAARPPAVLPSVVLQLAQPLRPQQPTRRLVCPPRSVLPCGSKACGSGAAEAYVDAV